MRITRILASVSIVVAVTGAGLGGGTARATTGDSNVTPVPALYKVPHSTAVRYLGAYSLQTAARGSRLTSAKIVVELNSLGYLQAIGSFYGYDAQGSRTSWVASFYNFHLIGANRMTVEVFGPLGGTKLGLLTFKRTANGDWMGQIALPKTPYSVVFHRTAVL
jgi:hypothetical protein